MNVKLTSGESRIAARVAAGRRNDEIAAELGLSRRTVEWHLTNVYRKLHVRGRTELVLTRPWNRRSRSRT